MSSFLQRPKGLIAIDRGHAIFDEIVPVRVVEEGDEASSCTVGLRIRVLHGTRRSNNQRVMRVEITDEDKNPYFLYFMEVSEEDFHALKADQSLRVDFVDFPEKFVELLRYCCPTTSRRTKFVTDVAANGGGDDDDEEAAEESEGTKDIRIEEEDAEEESGFASSKKTSFHLQAHPSTNAAIAPAFESVLRIASGTADASKFEILEANLFKNLLHLSLKVRAGKDADIKSLLAGRLQHERDVTERLSARVKSLSRRMSAKSDEYDAAAREIERLMVASRQESEAFAVRETASINRVTQEALKRAEKLQAEHARAMDDMRERSAAAQRELQQDMDKIRNEAKGWREKCYELESQLKATEARFEVTTKDLSTERSAAATLRKTLAETQKAQLDAERTLQKQRVELVKLRESRASDQRELERMTKRIENAELQRTKDAESVRRAEEVARRCQSQLERSALEIKKGNGIIQRLQAERKESRAKQKLTAQVLREQERRIEDGRKASVISKETIDRLTKKLEMTSADLTAVTSNRDEARKRLEESMRVLDENQKVITWLNRQLNDAKMQSDMSSIAVRSATSAYAFGGERFELDEKRSSKASSGDEILLLESSGAREHLSTRGLGEDPLFSLTLGPTTSHLSDAPMPPFLSSDSMRLASFGASAKSEPLARSRQENVPTDAKRSVAGKTAGVAPGGSSSKTDFADGLRMGSVRMYEGGNDENAFDFANDSLDESRRWTPMPRGGTKSASRTLDTYADLPNDNFGRVAAAALAATEDFASIGLS